MTLRARLALLTSLAVALAIVVASVTAWLLIRSSLLDDVDRSLTSRVPDGDRIAVATTDLRGDDAGPVPLIRMVQDNPAFVQVLAPDGQVAGQLAAGRVQIGPDVEEQLRVMEAGSETALGTVSIDGDNYRVMTANVLDDGSRLRVFQPLAGVEATLARIAWLLAAIAGVGVALAGTLGWVTARAGLRPVDRLVAAAEQVAATRDLAHRIDAGTDRDDEVARLAGAVNAMLAALDEARAQQRELVENAGHELRTPLAVLRNDLGLLLRSERAPDRELSAGERAQLLGNLETEVAALGDLVGEVIALARGEVDTEPFVEVDVTALAQRAVARTGRLDPKVHLAVTGEPIVAEVLPAALERAIANVVRNAVQVSPDGGTVEVTVDQDEGWARVEVTDDGSGIDPDDMPRLFDRFYRGAAARQRHGSGLGLAIADQAVRMHGGAITAANRPAGGAVFTLRVPARPSS